MLILNQTGLLARNLFLKELRIQYTSTMLWLQHHCNTTQQLLRQRLYKYNTRYITTQVFFRVIINPCLKVSWWRLVPALIHGIYQLQIPMMMWHLSLT